MLITNNTFIVCVLLPVELWSARTTLILSLVFVLVYILRFAIEFLRYLIVHYIKRFVCFAVGVGWHML
jgi:hypothetical protein